MSEHEPLSSQVVMHAGPTQKVVSKTGHSNFCSRSIMSEGAPNHVQMKKGVDLSAHCATCKILLMSNTNYSDGMKKYKRVTQQFAECSKDGSR